MGKLAGSVQIWRSDTGKDDRNRIYEWWEKGLEGSKGDCQTQSRMIKSRYDNKSWNFVWDGMEWLNDNVMAA